MAILQTKKTLKKRLADKATANRRVKAKERKDIKRTLLSREQIERKAHIKKQVKIHNRVQRAKSKIDKLSEDPFSSFSKLTYEDRLFIAYLFSGMTQVDAAMEAYNPGTKAQAGSKATQVLRTAQMQGAMQEVLSEENIDDTYLSKVLKKGLEAKKTYVDKDSGEMIESDHDDHSVQHKFLATAIDLKRKIAEDAHKQAEGLVGEEQFEKDQGTKPQEEKMANEGANAVSVVDFKKKYAKKPVVDGEISKDSSPSEEPKPSKKAKPVRKKARPA